MRQHTVAYVPKFELFATNRFRRLFTYSITNAASFFVLLGFATLVRLQVMNNPFYGYDEQFYLLMGDRMIHGALPYVDVFDRKPIGLFLIYAAVRLIGSDGFLIYKLVATLFAAATSWLIFRSARKWVGGPSALMAACFYLIGLDFMEGAGGQAEVIYNLPMLAAGLLIGQGATRDDAVLTIGCKAMLLVGLALQIKYTAIFEGLFLGGYLIWTALRQGHGIPEVMGYAVMWIGCALTPTFVAASYYACIGHLSEFVFANFESLAGRNRIDLWPQAHGLLEITVMLSPFLACAIEGLRGSLAEFRFFALWLAASIFGFLAFGCYGTPHYGLPILVPASLASALFFGRSRIARCWAVPALLLGICASQVVLARVSYLHGGRTEANALRNTLSAREGSVYVYSGPPGIYMLAGANPLTKWPFPNHLNSHTEDSIRAIGTNPEEEVGRVIHSHPTFIIGTAPNSSDENIRTNNIVRNELVRSYSPIESIKFGNGQNYIVYGLKHSSTQLANIELARSVK